MTQDVVFCPTLDFMFDETSSVVYLNEFCMRAFVDVMRHAKCYDAAARDPSEEYLLKRGKAEHDVAQVFRVCDRKLPHKTVPDDASDLLPTRYVSAHALRWDGTARYVACPFRHQKHYVLFVIDTQTNVVHYYNSFTEGVQDDPFIVAARKSLEKAFKRKFIVKPADVVQQKEAECGVAVCLYMWVVAKAGAPSDTIEDGDYFGFLQNTLYPTIEKIVEQREKENP
jgi:hypothetical protein